jgi:hypothetical protein
MHKFQYCMPICIIHQTIHIHPLSSIKHPSLKSSLVIYSIEFIAFRGSTILYMILYSLCNYVKEDAYEQVSVEKSGYTGLSTAITITSCWLLLIALRLLHL